MAVPRIPRWWAAVVLYALAAWLIARPLGLVDRTHLPTCACGDVAQEAWVFSLVHASVVQGHLSFLTTRIDAPSGVSLLNNAGFPLLAVLMAPVTAVAGPVTSLVVMLRLSFFVTALVTYLVLRRVTTTEVGALAGGAVYAFSPYMTHQAASHFFLVFGPVPPLLLLLVHRCLTGEERHRTRTGLLVGLLAVVQYLIDSEVLVMVAVVAAVTVAVVGLGRLVRRRPLRDGARRTASVVGWALVVASPLLAYPAWETLRGSQRLVGPTQPLSSGGVDVVGTLLPADRSVVAGLWSGWRITPQTFLGHSSYVGIPLVAVCGIVVWTNRRRPLVRVVALFGAVAWLLELGAHLQVGSHATSVPLPFATLLHLPVLQDIIPSRFAQFVALSVAVLVAVGVDQLTGAVGRVRRGRLAAATVGLLLGVTLVAPVSTYGAADIGAAADFRTAAAGALVGTGTALAYPYPAFPDDQAMLWQAESGMRFSLLGGYAIRPGAGRRSVRLPLVDAPRAVGDAWLQAWADPAEVRAGSPTWVAARRALPGLVRREHVTVILVQRAVPGAAAVAALVRSRYGPSRPLDGIDVWDLPTAPSGVGSEADGHVDAARQAGGIPAELDPGRLEGVAVGHAADPRHRSAHR